MARFRFPRNQYDRMYNGCHPIWGYEYREIREWMAPWWLMLIQFISAPAFLLMNIALVIDVALYLRIPMEHVLRSVEVVCRCDSISGPVSFPFHSIPVVDCIFCLVHVSCYFTVSIFSGSSTTWC